MFILLLIYFSLFIEILLDDTTSINLTKGLQNLTVTENDITPSISIQKDDGFYYFEIKPNDDENSLFNVTFYDPNEHINNSFTERYYNLKKPLIYIDSNISSVNKKEMLITCSPECNYILSYRMFSYPILKDNSNFSLYYKNNTLNKTI